MAKIKTVEHFRVKPRWLFVKLTDEDGKVGWGEATLEGHDLAVQGALEEIIVRIIGLEAKYASSRKRLGSPRCADGATATSNTSGNSYGAWASIEADRSSCLRCQASTSRFGI
jgi:L-alanine-DL-glutamate epimerase-like enolase superfamily enzyme